MNRRLAFLCLAAAFTLSACPPKGFVPAPDPRRPKPREIEATDGPGADCQPLDPDKGDPPKPYASRVPDMAESLADEGVKFLTAAEDPAKPRPEQAQKMGAAVGKFTDALSMDPYNPKATYFLAAAYARAGKPTCSLNLLARLAEMASFPSKRDDIEGFSSRLLGRNKWKGKPDPDFDALRTNARFIQIAGQLQ
jgi:hypothetical protein